MGNQLNSEAAEGWPVFEDSQRRFFLRRPPDWDVLSESPDITVVRDKNLFAELTIAFLESDCANAQNTLRARRLNYYFVREFKRSLAGLEVAVLEFRDTISNVREFHVFSPAERRCCHLRWRRSERSEGLKLEPVLETMLSTFRFLTTRS